MGSERRIRGEELMIRGEKRRLKGKKRRITGLYTAKGKNEEDLAIYSSILPVYSLVLMKTFIYLYLCIN